MKRTPKIIKQQTEEWLDERWMIANMKDTRPQGMNGNVMQTENIHYSNAKK